RLLDTLKPGGRYIFFGATQGDADEGLSMAKLFFKQIRIQGSTMGNEQEFGKMLEFVEKNSISPIIDKVYPIEEAREAHERMLNSEQTGKIVLKILNE
ncbi:MAG: zinc-binding dehydrogenase, partial [Pseudomonadota bacterium]|nr:zinc-binding dehydrogenase [Pseudomonadota bacterium]